MKPQKVFRVAILGTPHAERWLLDQAFAESRGRDWCYERALDEAPHMFVIDPETQDAVVRWGALDPNGVAPAVFFERVHPRAKFAVIVARPITSGRILDSLDQLARRISVFSERVSARKVSRAGMLRPVLV